MLIVFFILPAHRLSTIQKADQIAVIAGGCVAEMGTHTRLKKAGGIYSDLIKQQELEEVIEKETHQADEEAK